MIHRLSLGVRDLARGQTCHDAGKPGLLPPHHPTYYAAFVRDPDGRKIGAVRPKPEASG